MGGACRIWFSDYHKSSGKAQQVAVDLEKGRMKATMLVETVGKSPSTSLFSRLILYFLVVMAIPIALLSFYYATTGKAVLARNLTEQGEQNIQRIGNRFMNIVESYRHKAYAISVNPKIIAELESDSYHTPPSTSKEIYEELFKIMKGDTYLACASVVSSSGNLRYSTHQFPELYDLRYNKSDWNPFFNLSRANSDTASIISTQFRYATENNSFVFLNILRRVRDADRNEIGYVVVDIFQEAISQLNTGFSFSDIILIDTEHFLASSLLHTDRYGDFSHFPELSGVSAPYQKSSYADEERIVSLASIPNTQLILAGVTFLTPYQQSIEHFFIIIVLVTILGTLMAGILAYFFSRSIARPVNQLANSMHQVKTGNLETQVKESNIVEFNQLDRSFNTMVKQITALLELTREEEAKLREAERKALESQMNPHFLYNTLNTVKAIAKLHGEEEITTIITKLGKLLRNSIDNRDAEMPLQDSFSLVESYLTIQRIRFGEKLHVHLHLDEALQTVRTPKLIIQPLVENAIIHGLEPKVGIWRISITAVVSHGRVVIDIADNGIGMRQGTLPGNLDLLSGSDHVGIYNIYRRLRLRYGQSAFLGIDSIEGEGTTVTISFPLEAQP